MSDLIKKIANLRTLRYHTGASFPLQFPMPFAPATPTQLHSPREGKAHDVTPPNFETLLDQFIEVRECCLKTKSGVYDWEFMERHWPKQWGVMPTEWPDFLSVRGITPEDPISCAQAVRMDSPIDLTLAILSWLLPRGIEGRLQDKSSHHFDFIRTIPHFIAYSANRIDAALEKAFDIKYYYGMPRPAEVCDYLYENETSQFLQTYDHPNHPAYVAGHGSAAGACGKAFQDYFLLTPSENQTIRYACYSWSQWRTLAGMHYAADNVVGLLEVGGID